MGIIPGVWASVVSKCEWGDGSNAPPTKLIGTGPPTKPPSLFSTLKTLTFTEQLLNKLVFFFAFVVSGK